MIDQLVAVVSEKLGIDASMAEKAVGVVMGLVNKDGDNAAVSALFDKLPGAAALAQQYGGEITEGGGGLLGKVSGMLGGNTGDLMGALGALKQTGLSVDQLGEMAPLIKNFMTEHAGEDTVRQALGSVPALKDFLG